MAERTPGKSFKPEDDPGLDCASFDFSHRWMAGSLFHQIVKCPHRTVRDPGHALPGIPAENQVV